MPSSAEHDGYIVCMNMGGSGSYAGSCSAGIDAAIAHGSIAGGTSAATPVFAGIVALLNQSLGNDSHTGLGNINPTLYAYAQSTPSAFHDVPAGSYGNTDQPSGNQELCEAATPNCSDQVLGYYTAAGYDLATGLGSVDGDVFVKHWPGGNSAKTATNLTVSLNPDSISAGSTAGVTLTATVAAGSGSGTPAGTVTFLNGTAVIGEGRLNGGKATASYDASQLAAGIYSITSLYGGDTQFAGSTSQAVVLTVTGGGSGLQSTATALAIMASPSATQSNAGSAVSFTATVTASGGMSVPTGTVKFNNGSTLLGSVTLNSSGTATFSSSALTANQYSITAIYSGDSNYRGSSSNAGMLDVVDFQIGANPSTITVGAPGQSGSATVTITPLDGFNQSLSMTCSGLPADSSCSFQSASTGGTVTITTTGPGLAASAGSAASLGAVRSNGGDPFYALALPGLVVLGLSGFRKRRLRALQLPMLLAACMLTSLLVACGGGSGGSGGGGGTGGTQPGTSTVTITATAGQLSHQTTITLIVQ